VPDTVYLPDRIEVTRPIPAPAAAIFDIVRSPAGQVAIDASGMLQSYTGEPAEQVGDTFVIHMDRESLNDFPLGKYDVTVHIIAFERDREIAWDLGPDIPVRHFYGYRLEPGEDGVTNVISYYDWSRVNDDAKPRFPIVPESALRATLGILSEPSAPRLCDSVRRRDAQPSVVHTSDRARMSASAMHARWFASPRSRARNPHIAP
jgi:hypothetical protein